MRRAAGLALAGALLASGAAWPCGVCVEDKVAATYDHAVIGRAAGAGHVVVFAEVRGRDGGAVSAARRAAARVRGIDPASVRASEEPAALSFALDERVRSPSEALAAVRAAARPPGFELRLLKVMRAP